MLLSVGLIAAACVPSSLPTASPRPERSMASPVPSPSPSPTVAALPMPLPHGFVLPTGCDFQAGPVGTTSWSISCQSAPTTREAFFYWIDREMSRQGWHLCNERGSLLEFLQMPSGQVVTEIEFGITGATFALRQRPGTIPCK